MKVTVIGGGAIGLLVTSYLLTFGHTVQLVTRTKEQTRLIKENGIMKEKNGFIESHQVDVVTISKFQANKEDLIIITVKQTSVDSLIDYLRQIIPPETPLLFLQNGMGHLEKARKTLQNPILAGIVTHGAIRQSLTRVSHTGEGEIKIGGERLSEKPLFNLWSNDSTFSITWSPNILVDIKQKLLVNVVVNPLTAIHKVRNGILLLDSELKKKAYEVFQEARFLLDFPDSEWQNVQRVIHKTAENQSSMLIDILHNRKTEIDALTGYLLEQSDKKNIPIEKIRGIHQRVKEIEKGM
ncbi:2-dehydropantoate 2-reductase [Salipaludibacillus sp. CF4.18]|uniref:2-dehydropantoate 2-reductase n=1 Tax=Salipaludibacillus sp. CF4.18 TaxID=3373081 RepID=UPI003EE6EE51